MDVPLLVVALAFAVVNGVNDGAAMLAVGLEVPGVRPLTAILLLAAALAVVPALLGTAVADTLARGLVDSPQENSAVLLAVAIVAASAVVGGLAMSGLPTSLTLAVVGSIVGAGIGAGYGVVWTSVALVALIGLVAPLVGGVTGHLLARLPWRTTRAGTANTHRIAFGTQTIAYGANDGQKMFALFLVGGASTGIASWQLLAVAVCFALGTVLGMRRAAQGLGRGVVAGRPRQHVSAELAASVSVLGSAAFGAPVSMTQAVSGALIGAGVTRGYRRVRWRAASRLALAWMLTMPLAALAGAFAGWIAEL